MSQNSPPQRPDPSYMNDILQELQEYTIEGDPWTRLKITQYSQYYLKGWNKVPKLKEKTNRTKDQNYNFQSINFHF